MKTRMKSVTDTRGFTLVELLVVITIIGILAVGGLSLFAGAQQKARDAVRATDMRALLTTVEQMSLDRVGGDDGAGPCGAGNGYPSDATDLTLFYDKITNFGYLDKVPKDPTNAGSFKYRYVATTVADKECSAYEISTQFEHAANGPKMIDSEDLGEDDNRFELGTPSCLGSVIVDQANCPDTTGALDTSDNTTDIAYP